MVQYTLNFFYNRICSSHKDGSQKFNIQTMPSECQNYPNAVPGLNIVNWKAFNIALTPKRGVPWSITKYSILNLPVRHAVSFLSKAGDSFRYLTSLYPLLTVKTDLSLNGKAQFYCYLACLSSSWYSVFYAWYGSFRVDKTTGACLFIETRKTVILVSSWRVLVDL